MPRHDPDRSQRSPAQCTVDDGLDRPFVGQGDDTDGGPPPRSRGGSPRARRPARRALVVLEGGVPRRPVTSSRRHTRACAGGRRGRPARCGGGSPDSAGGSRALPRACGDGGVDGSTPRRGPRVPDNRRCRTSRYGSSRTTSVPVSRTRTGNGSSAARTPARCIGVITKSGGNAFSGSWRTNYDKPTWEGLNPYEVENEVERQDILNQTHEATLGGPIARDRLWFFYSFRRARTTDSASFAQTGISYSTTNNNDRNQIKLTATLSPGHTLSGQYMRNQTSQFDGPTFGFSITPDTQNDETGPNDLYVTTYRGSVSRNVFAEAQVSQKRFGFRGGGGDQTAIGHSPFVTLTQELGHYNAPYFDANDLRVLLGNVEQSNEARNEQLLQQINTLVMPHVAKVARLDNAAVANERGQILDRKRYGRASFQRFLETRPPLA